MADQTLRQPAPGGQPGSPERFAFGRLRAEVSADRAFEALAGLHATERFSTFSHYARTAEFAASQFRAAGLSDVELIRLPADGRTRFADWTMPLAWDVSEAKLEVAPDPGGAPLPLCSWREEPSSLVMWSAPTPPEGITVELVLDGSDAGPVEDWRGKLVLTGRRAQELKLEAVRRGALGIVSDYHPAPDEFPESTFWNNGWGDAPGGWMPTARDSRLFGFSLSPAQGRRLRELALARPGLKLRARVAARLYEGELPIVTGVIPGADASAGEVLLSAHIYEPGAHDNCSGGGAVIEAARALAALVARGALPRPRRAIRFMLQAECYGTVAYASLRPDAIRRTLAAVTLDGVGKSGPLAAYRLPACQPSFVEQLSVEALRAYFPDPERFRVLPFSLGDNLLNDPAIGVPCAWFNTVGPPKHWHTTADRLDVVDRSAVADGAAVAAGALFFAARGDAGDARWLCSQIGAERLRAAREAAEGGDSVRMDFELSSARRALSSCARLVGSEDRAAVTASADAASREIEALRRGGPPAAAGPGEDEVPVRKFIAPLTFAGLSPEHSRALGGNPCWWGSRAAAWWWCDGQRSLAEIARLVRCEFPENGLDVPGYLRALARHGYLALESAK